MQLFYCPDIPEGGRVLPESESKHCIQVLRHTKGDRITVIDGRGGLYLADIINDHKKQCEVKVIEKRMIEDVHPYIHLAVAAPKTAERLEFMLEKVIEIGINEISFIKSFHSERKDVKIERLEKIALAAIKQSHKGFLPKLNAQRSIHDFLEEESDASKWIASYHEYNEDIAEINFDFTKKNIIMIGPEGDFSEEELTLSKKHDYAPINLGEYRLRTETAAISAVQSLRLKHRMNS